MNSNLLMDFSVDKENNRIIVKREFAAPVASVWAAWTQSELLDQWWAPKPYKAVTRTMDFREGGYWHYAMTGPEGDSNWCKMEYKTITREQNYTVWNGFSDEHGGRNTTIPGSDMSMNFSTKGNHTLVTVTMQFDKLEDLEMIISMGFKEGFTAALENLDEIFAGK